MKNETQRERWGWEIALEMFFVGSGAGAFLLIALLQVLIHLDLPAKIILIPFVLMLVGVIFLLLEIGHPLRSWRSVFNLGSTISLGAVMMSLLVFMIFLLVLSSSNKGGIPRYLLGPAIVLAIGVVLYPGVLIGEVRGRTSILSYFAPILFVASSVSNGAAWLTLEGVLAGKWISILTTVPLLNLVIFCFVMAQLVILISWVILSYRLGEEKRAEVLRIYGQGKKEMVLSGVGLLIPLVSMVAASQTLVSVMIQSLSVLISGVLLRFLLLGNVPKNDFKEIKHLLQIASLGARKDIH